MTTDPCANWPKEYQHVTPNGAQVIIELCCSGRGFAGIRGDYFRLAETADGGIAVWMHLNVFPPFQKAFSLSVTKQEVNEIKAELRAMPLGLGEMSATTGGTDCVAKLQVHKDHELTMRWNMLVPAPWKGVRDIVHRIRDKILASPERQLCTPAKNA